MDFVVFVYILFIYGACNLCKHSTGFVYSDITTLPAEHRTLYKQQHESFHNYFCIRAFYTMV